MCLAYCDWRAGQYHWSSEGRDEQMARALDEAERAVQLDPRDPDAYYVLSLAARNRGELERSVEALHHCLRLAASYAPAHGQLAQACLRRGKVDEARAHCRSAFALSPLEPLRVIWHCALAEACLITGDAKGAVEEAQRGMAVNSAFAQLYVFGAAAAWQLQAVDQAREWVSKLGEHPAFSSLEAVRVALLPTYAPAAMGQYEHLMRMLGEAGLPAR
jgi:tetratricopeptide (TPR) repeat protein